MVDQLIHFNNFLIVKIILFYMYMDLCSSCIYIQIFCEIDIECVFSTQLYQVIKWLLSRDPIY